MSILVVAEHDNNEIKGSTLNTVTAASKIGGDVSVLVAGSESSSAAEQASKISGISSVIHVDDPIYKNFLAEDLGNLAASIAEGFNYRLAPATTFGKNFLPRVAAKLDVQQISDIISVEDADTFKRPIYAGSCIATVKSNDSVKVITVRTTAFDASPITDSSVTVNSGDVVDSLNNANFVSDEIAESDRPELTAAEVIVSGGRALGSSENFKIIEALADKLGAAVGASRAAVDAGYVPKPEAQTFDLMVKKFGINPKETIYIEDIAKNLSIGFERGCTTVWLINDEHFGKIDSDKDYISHKIENLSLFLKEIRLLKSK